MVSGAMVAEEASRIQGMFLTDSFNSVGVYAM